MSTYSDIDISFSSDAAGNLRKVEDYDAISQSIRTILTTSYGERVMLPDFGSRIRDLLFEDMTPILQIQLETEIETAISRWEPRVEITAVYVEMLYDRNAIEINIDYSIVGGGSGSFNGILQKR